MMKGYATHKKAVFERVTQARADALSATGPAQAEGAAEGRMQQALKSLFAVSPGIP